MWVIKVIEGVQRMVRNWVESKEGSADHIIGARQGLGDQGRGVSSSRKGRRGGDKSRDHRQGVVQDETGMVKGVESISVGDGLQCRS